MEKALRELHAAEGAGVFRATPTAERSPQGLWRVVVVHRRLFVPLAAAAALAIGVWGMMWSVQLDRLRAQKLGPVASAVESDCDGSFLKCFQGMGAGGDRCAAFDYDHDGDIDLADFGVYQMDCDGPVALR